MNGPEHLFEILGVLLLLLVVTAHPDKDTKTSAIVAWAVVVVVLVAALVFVGTVNLPVYRLPTAGLPECPP